MELFKIQEISDYETYQKALNELDSLYLRTFFIAIVTSMILLLILYKTKAKGLFGFDKRDTVLIWISSSVAVALIMLLLLGGQKIKVEEKMLTTPNIIYKWEEKKTFPLDQIQVELSNNTGTSMILTVSSKENESIDMNAEFVLDRQNTSILNLDKEKQEKLVLEERILTDNRFESLVQSDKAKERSFLSNLIYSNRQPTSTVRWIFHVTEQNKELLQLHEIDF